ncbi:hypothetical protein [Pseudonocardia acaciae]|uniref:hypothetical protein n=1 Tax=Pseudonocardia acaciae TaxID=551276 RepID=UPI00048FCBBF|nr:hypothetical protein [Pseudonocardia acaciae]
MHAVLDGIIRNAFYEGTLGKGLPAVRGARVHPIGHLPARNAKLHGGCVTALESLTGAVEPRPGPGNPLLGQMARLYPSGDGSW